jgi:hypothetical protein
MVPAGAMTRERRDTPRIPIALDVMLRQADDRFQRCVTRDISLDGLFVETAAALNIAPRRSTYLAIKIPDGGRTRIHHFHARPVYVKHDGAAFVFDRVAADGYAALLELVYSRQPKGLW